VKLRVLFLLITIILVLILAVQTVMAIVHNHNLRKNYKHNPYAYKYKEAIINGDLDLKKIRYIFPQAMPAINFNITKVISTPVTIRYYNAIGDLSPAYVIDKGERIRVKKENSSPYNEAGYGLLSLTTHIAGWRIAYPFNTDNGFITDAGTSEKLLYVRLDDLYKVARSWVRMDKTLTSFIQKELMTRNGYARRTVLFADRLLYERGVYLSPDLFVPVSPTSSLIISAMAVLSACTWVFLRFARKQ